MEAILEVKGLTKLYKNNRGIKDISFEVRRGDIFGFLGPNGAGKTTTMKIITGLCRPDQGEARIMGKDVFNSYEAAMAKVGCIIEAPEAYEYMSAYKNLELAARFYNGISGVRIGEVLDRVGLGKFKHEKVSGYSMGMKQRLGLASAILSKPELLILDEPANGLDIEGTFDIRNMITSLANEENITFFISSHMIHDMEMTCSRVGIVHEGRMIATGDVSDLLREHSSLEEFFIKQVREDKGRCA